MIKKLKMARHLPVTWLACRRLGVSRTSQSWFFGMPIVKVVEGAKISMGDKVTAISAPRYNEIGVSHPCIFSLLTKEACLDIGSGVGMSGVAIAVRSSVKIGDNVLLGRGVTIIDNDAHPLDMEGRLNGGEPKAKPVVIDEGAFIGANAIILKGVSIGKGAIIGAGSVVSKSIPAFKIYAGNPAREVADSK